MITKTNGFIISDGRFFSNEEEAIMEDEIKILDDTIDINVEGVIELANWIQKYYKDFEPMIKAIIAYQDSLPTVEKAK